MSELCNLPVRELKEHFGLRSFVETGTHEGKGLDFAIEIGFEQYHSCDIVQKYAEPAFYKYGGNQGSVQIFHGDSLAFLRQLPQGIGPTLFWLDAHQPWAYDHEIAETYLNKFPVLFELELIRQRPGYERDVILMDDLIVIQGSPRWHEGEVCDYFQVRDIDWPRLVGYLAETHVAEVNLGQEGILMFLPKAGV